MIGEVFFDMLCETATLCNVCGGVVLLEQPIPIALQFRLFVRNVVSQTPLNGVVELGSDGLSLGEQAYFWSNS